MNKTHGMYMSAEYISWQAMKNRCFNFNSSAYLSYGGRDITVCDRWKDSFENFLADMGKRPTIKHSIDRINNDGGYFPENCRWSTAAEQANNKRNYKNSRLITVGCVTLTSAQWSKEMGFKKSFIGVRLTRGWSEIDAVTTKVNFKSA